MDDEGDCLGRWRLGRAHIMTEQLVTMHIQDGGASKAAAVPIIIALAAVFRFSFDIGSFHAEFGATPSGEWGVSDDGS